MGEGEGGMIWENSIETWYYQVWNRSPVQVGCMRQVLGAGALGRPRGMGWGGRWKEGSGWGTHVNPWLIHVNVWHKPLQYCKVISLQLIKIKTVLINQWHSAKWYPLVRMIPLSLFNALLHLLWQSLFKVYFVWYKCSYPSFLLVCISIK